MTVSILRRRALKYFGQHPNGVAWFDKNAPSQAMRDLMVRKGELERVLPPGGVGMIRWKLSAIGRARLGI